MANRCTGDQTHQFVWNYCLSHNDRSPATRQGVQYKGPCDSLQERSYLHRHDRHLRFLGHMLRGTYSPHARTYTLYQPTHGSTRRGRPRTNWNLDYIQKLTGLKINELVEASEMLDRMKMTFWNEVNVIRQIRRCLAEQWLADQAVDLKLHWLVGCKPVELSWNDTISLRSSWDMAGGTVLLRLYLTCQIVRHSEQ